MIKAVFFDLDDSLISEKEYVKSGFKHIAKLLANLYGEDEKQVYLDLEKLFQSNALNVFNRWYESKGLTYSKEDIIKLVQEYRSHEPSIKYYDDVIPCINKLKSQGIIVGIITDGYSVAQAAKIKSLNAKDLFDYIYITDQLGKEFWKPSPKVFEIIKQQLNIGYDEIVYIGDNPKKDFYFYHLLQIKCLRIIRKDSIYQNEPYHNDIKELFASDNLNELIDYILKL